MTAGMNEAEARRSAFFQKWPELWARIADMAVSDIPDGAADRAQAALAAWRQAPDGIVFGDPSHCNLSAVSLHLRDELVAWLEANGGIASLSTAPAVDAAFLFVFGLGDGAALPALLAETTARIVVFVETDPGIARRAAETADWSGLFDIAARRGRAIRWIVETDIQAIVVQLERLLHGIGNTFLDGSAIVRLGRSWLLDAAHDALRERLPNFHLSRGFFEDEVEMMRNCHANLARLPVRVVEDRPVTPVDTPLFLIGSGPSLDRDLPHIARCRDRATIISCGTALRVLLRNGIRPDFHCEVERVPAAAALMRELAAEHSLSGIVLIASSTAHPETCGLFDEVWMYWRAAVGPARIINPGIAPLRHADPLVTNAALEATAALGFRQIYLFGCDLALGAEGSHHARDAAYYDEDKAHLNAEYRASTPRSVPGNFGGQVTTLWAYDLARRMLGVVARRSQLTLFNCSHGARIEDAAPKVATALNFAGPTLDRNDLRRRIGAPLRQLRAGQGVAALGLSRHAEACRHAAPVLGRLAAAMAAAPGFWQAESLLRAFLLANGESLAGFQALAKSSMVSMLRLGAFFGTRIADPARRSAYLAVFAEAYRARCVGMAEESHRLLAAAARGDVGFLPAATPPPEGAD